MQLLDWKLEDILKHYKKFKPKDIKFFISKKIIEFPLTGEDLIKLNALHKIWRSKKALALQLKNFSRQHRERILKESYSGANSRLEQWLYTRIANLKESGKKVYAEQLIKEVIRHFNLKNTKKTEKELRRLIRNIKERVRYQVKSKEQKSNKYNKEKQKSNQYNQTICKGNHDDSQNR
ncbi:hypothetical protein [Thermodesulfovibrio yellowstonii]|uniref:hypothetical protein n=1 Tax=Thermodesulfovibrio yellowstonii TaxID=28262 RepID=UPI0003F541AF|nr:hypothetical protein [Thermodesulfovibrio islandicus]